MATKTKNKTITATDLTNGERLVIHRRRQDWTQRQAAESHGVTLYRYRKWEKDEDGPPKIGVGRLEPFEVCFLLRRREEIPAAELARALGISRWWLTQMETGRAPAESLVEYWAA